MSKACKSDIEQGRLTSDPESYAKGNGHRNPAVSQCTLASSSEDESSEKIQGVLNLFPPPTPSAVTLASYSKNIHNIFIIIDN